LQALFSVDLLSILKRHYGWNKVVFDSATLLEPGQLSASMARVHYVGAWKALVRFYLFKLLPIGSPAVVDLLDTAAEILGPSWIPLLEMKRIQTTSNSISPPTPIVGCSTAKNGYLMLRRLNSEANAAAERGADDDGDQMPQLALEVDEFDLSPNRLLGKRPSTSSAPTLTPTKRRKRRAQDVFDVPKRFRLNQSKDIIFIFHATDARAVMKYRLHFLNVYGECSCRSPVPVPIAGTAPAWFKWLVKKGCTTGKSGSVPSRSLPWNGSLDAATFYL
jgi:hypothetical protein